MSQFEEVQLTEDGGVIKRIYEQGEDLSPEDDQTVYLTYIGKLENGTIFDQSRDDPFSFTLGVGQVIKGWDIGVKSMKLGERADLIIKSEYGYGETGSPPKIPGGATLIFTVELVKIEERYAKKFLKSDEELFAEAKQIKDSGNEKFKASKLLEAEADYAEAIHKIDKMKEQTKEAIDFKKTVHLNISVVQNKSHKYSQVIFNTSQALAIDEKATKALFLRAQAHAAQKNFDLAMADIKEAIKIAPGDKALREEFEKIKAARQKEINSEAQIAQKLFSGGLYGDKKIEKKQEKKEEDEDEDMENEKESSVEKSLPEFKQENPQVYFEIGIGEEGTDSFKKGRVVFELFNQKTPKTSENFRQLCTGEHEGLTYKNNIFHRIIKDFMMQGGDITNQNGTGGKSIYGHKFNDEGVWLPHTHKGLLSMANSGPNTNGSQFFITYAKTAWLDGKHTVFGRVISGYDICEQVENIKTGAQDKPEHVVKILDCGELKGDDKLSEDTADFLKSYA